MLFNLFTASILNSWDSNVRYAGVYGMLNRTGLLRSWSSRPLIDPCPEPQVMQNSINEDRRRPFDRAVGCHASEVDIIETHIAGQCILSWQPLTEFTSSVPVAATLEWCRRQEPGGPLILDAAPWTSCCNSSTFCFKYPGRRFIVIPDCHGRRLLSSGGRPVSRGVASSAHQLDISAAHRL